LSVRRVVRPVIHIDPERCDGCGACIQPCVEGAIQLIDGKARVLREELCDGAGFCLSACPTGALTVEVREAEPFDPKAAEQPANEQAATRLPVHCFRCGRTDSEVVLLAGRRAGRPLWVCTGCLPALIHSNGRVAW
jgi:NAD-dependent dihydropyrimidine dehydrogenase PreA subunit